VAVLNAIKNLPALARAVVVATFMLMVAVLLPVASCKSRSSTSEVRTATAGDPATWMTAPQVPAAIAPPPQAMLVAHFHATGAQIYVCKVSSEGSPAWTLKAPDATLFAVDGTEVGTHGAGPSWSVRDGSRVTAKKIAQVNAPDGAGIPWLLLRVTSATGNGLLSSATYVQRVRTARGTTPTGGCLGATIDSEVRIDYAAEYYVYSGGAAAEPADTPAH
jgi:Protein of unknown function (DUF3455)